MDVHGTQLQGDRSQTKHQCQDIDIYKDNLCKKTGCLSRVGLVIYAIKNDIFSL